MVILSILSLITGFASLLFYIGLYTGIFTVAAIHIFTMVYYQNSEFNEIL